MNEPTSIGPEPRPPRSSRVAEARRIVEEAYGGHASALVAFARRLGMDDDEAWDAVQEAHIRLWQQLSDGVDVRDLRAWLAGTTYRLAMDRHRLSRRLRALRDRLAPAAAGDADRSDDRMAVWAAVDRLPVRQRAAVYLHYRLDLPFDDVASAMGISSGAARTLASRGIAAVKLAFTITEESDA